MRDVLYSLRQFSKAPGFTFLAVLCLGLGIGVNASIFSVLNSLFLRPLPVIAPDRLIVLSRAGAPLLSYPDFRDFRDRSVTLTGMAASFPTESSLDFDGLAHNAAAEAVSLEYPSVIGVRPFLGHWFQSEDEDSCVISYRAWRRLFDADPNVLGKRVRSETQWYTVTGVAPKEFEGIYLPMSIDLWVPLHHWTQQHPGMNARFEDRAQPTVFIFGRLKQGTAPRQAAAEINAIAEQVETSETAETKPAPIVVEQVRGIPAANSRRNAAPVAIVLMAVVGVILLIACVNVGNLLIARGAARHREISVRVALGASRSRLLRQLLTESLLLAIGGGIAGIFLGIWTNRLLERLLSAGPYESVSLDLAADKRVLLFTALLSLATTLMFGLAPAWRSSRIDVVAGLKGSAPTGGRFGLRRVSLIAQVSLSLILLLTAGLFIRVLGEFHSADPGFAVENRLYVSTYVSAPEFTPESGRAFYAAVLDRLRALPGVKNAAITNYLPLTPLPQSCASTSQHDSIPTTSSIIGSNFLETMRTPLLAGRDFRSVEPQPVAIVNEAMAKRLWPGETAIGKYVQLGCRKKTVSEVVGIARDLHFVSVGEPAKPHAYLPFARSDDGYQTILVEVEQGHALLSATIRKTIVATNPAARVYAVNTLADWVDRSFWQVRWEVSILTAFATLALLLAAVGLYGMISYQVTLRGREIGIRMAVGAQSSDVFRLILRQCLGSTLIGIAMGLVFSAAIVRLMAKLLYGVSPTDPPTYLAVSLLWLIVSAAACYVPARRAAGVDPMTVLKAE